MLQLFNWILITCKDLGGSWEYTQYIASASQSKGHTAAKWWVVGIFLLFKIGSNIFFSLLFPKFLFLKLLVLQICESRVVSTHISFTYIYQLMFPLSCALCLSVHFVVEPFGIPVHFNSECLSIRTKTLSHTTTTHPSQARRVNRDAVYYLVYSPHSNSPRCADIFKATFASPGSYHVFSYCVSLVSFHLEWSRLFLSCNIDILGNSLTLDLSSCFPMIQFLLNILGKNST